MLINLFSRDLTRKIVKENSTEAEILARYPGFKANLIERATLLAAGYFQEVHCDGHEKIEKKGLGMGDVSLPIYVFREKTGGILLLEVVPDSRNAQVVGHLHLDMVEDGSGDFSQLFFIDYVHVVLIVLRKQLLQFR